MSEPIFIELYMDIESPESAVTGGEYIPDEVVMAAAERALIKHRLNKRA